MVLLGWDWRTSFDIWIHSVSLHDWYSKERKIPWSWIPALWLLVACKLCYMLGKLISGLPVQPVLGYMSDSTHQTHPKPAKALPTPQGPCLCNSWGSRRINESRINESAFPASCPLVFFLVSWHWAQRIPSGSFSVSLFWFCFVTHKQSINNY